MARHYMQTLEPTAPEVKPSAWPAPAPTRDPVTGLEVAWERCPKCGQDFMQTRSPRLGLITAGECNCEALQREARALLATRGEAISKRVEQKLAASSKDRERRVDDEIQRLIATERPRIAEELRWHDLQAFTRDAQAEELAAIMAELKKGA